mmetsp:Transcript_124915/g.303364  ORF Transcript_124915/g.303364 Transcript_124915/m.303364 type:complete len:290 (-) Transcript_124915:69-938(-)
MRDQLLQRRGDELGEPEVHLRRQLEAFRPRLCRRVAHNAADLVDLVGLRRAREERPQREQLSHYATAGKGIDGRVVHSGAQQHLGCAVPARRHVVRVGRPRADLARKAEVSDLARVALAQHVLGLDITVEEPVLVHEGQALEDLEHDVADLRLREVLLACLHQLVQVLLHVLEHEEELVILTDHFLELDNVGVVELLEALDLAQLHALFPRVELLLHLLDGHHLPRGAVDGLEDGPVGAVPELHRDFVAVHGGSAARAPLSLRLFLFQPAKRTTRVPAARRLAPRPPGR